MTMNYGPDYDIDYDPGFEDEPYEGKIDYATLPGGRIQPIVWSSAYPGGPLVPKALGSAYGGTGASQGPQWRPGEQALDEAAVDLAYKKYENDAASDEADRELRKAQQKLNEAIQTGNLELQRQAQASLEYWKGKQFDADQEQIKIDNQLRSRGLDLTEFNLNLQKMGLFGYDDQGKPTLDRDKFNQAITQWNDQFGLAVGKELGYYDNKSTLARDELDALTAYRKGELALRQGNLDEAKRQFDIAEGFQQRLDAAKLQFDIERDPASFLQKIFAISGEQAPEDADIIGALKPLGWGTKAPQVGQAQEARPWYMNYSNERLMQMPIEELATLPDEVLEQMPNEFFMQSPAHQQLIGRLSPGRIGGQGQWAGTGFASDVAAQYPGRQGAAGAGRAYEPRAVGQAPAVGMPFDTGFVPGGTPDRSGWGADVGEPRLYGTAPDIGQGPSNPSWGVDQGPMMSRSIGTQAGPTDDDAFALAEEISRRYGGMQR